MMSLLKWRCVVMVWAMLLLPVLLYADVKRDGKPERVDSAAVVIHRLFLVGNDITRPRIITRELLFAEGDTIRGGRFNDLLASSYNNLKNTSLFNFVHVSVDTLLEAGLLPSVDVVVDVKEQWYTWPFPVLELADRNFNVWWNTRDFSRLNYGAFLVRENFRGRMERLNLLFKLGYDQHISVLYDMPYINKTQTVGLSFSVGYVRSHEMGYATVEDKQRFLKLENDYAQQEFFAAATLRYRDRNHYFHYLGMEYTDYNFSDSLLRVNPRLSYRSETMMRYLSAFYQYKIDFRDYKHYPLKGSYFDVKVQQDGLGMFSDFSVLSVKSNWRHYFRLSSRWFGSAGMALKYTSASHPYVNLRALGYGRDYVRGYEYYVIDGRHFGLMKCNVKYNLLPERKFRVGFIRSEKFNTVPVALYITSFFDAGMVTGRNHYSVMNSDGLRDRWLRGAGIGLDVVTYYDKALRMEYTLNHRGETGFFIHFMAAL